MPSREILSSFVLEAKKGKGKGKGGDAAKRSRFLGIVMKSMSGDAGKAMANAIEAQDLEKFKTLWSQATNVIISNLEQKFGKTDKPAQPKDNNDGNNTNTSQNNNVPGN